MAVDLELLIRDDTGHADLVFANGDLVLERGLRSMVLVALFSDARVPEGESFRGDDPRGYWAEEPTDPFGSQLWRLDGGKLTTLEVVKAREWAELALQFMTAQRIAARVQVAVERVARERLLWQINLTRGDGARWARLWDTEARRLEFFTDISQFQLLAHG